MNKKTFLDNLSTLRGKYSWMKRGGKYIRSRNCGNKACPLQVMNHDRNKSWDGYYFSAGMLEISYALKLEIITAADYVDKNNKLRQSMLRRLGLPLDK
jgi:hypothetical protein